MASGALDVLPHSFRCLPMLVPWLIVELSERADGMPYVRSGYYGKAQQASDEFLVLSWSYRAVSFPSFCTKFGTSFERHVFCSPRTYFFWYRVVVFMFSPISRSLGSSELLRNLLLLGALMRFILLF